MIYKDNLPVMILAFIIYARLESNQRSSAPEADALSTGQRAHL